MLCGLVECQETPLNELKLSKVTVHVYCTEEFHSLRKSDSSTFRAKNTFVWFWNAGNETSFEGFQVLTVHVPHADDTLEELAVTTKYCSAQQKCKTQLC